VTWGDPAVTDADHFNFASGFACGPPFHGCALRKAGVTQVDARRKDLSEGSADTCSTRSVPGQSARFSFGTENMGTAPAAEAACELNSAPTYIVG
jgi:hypothetical protein